MLARYDEKRDKVTGKRLSGPKVAAEFGVSLIVLRRLLDERAGKVKTGQYPVLAQYLDKGPD